MSTHTTQKESMTLQYIAALGVGLLFAIGLGVSGMTQPAKVIGFLDFFGGSWDPALAFVMGGGVLVYTIGYRLTVRRNTPVFAKKFQLPTRRDIDKRLVIGGLLFGAGWGLGGYCPGPALTSIASVSTDVFVFVASMLSGMLLFSTVDKMLANKTSQGTVNKDKKDKKEKATSMSTATTNA